jgi:hypothetical protein
MQICFSYSIELAEISGTLLKKEVIGLKKKPSVF